MSETFPNIAQTSELLREGIISPVDLVRQCLSRIEKLNPKLNAFITVNSESAIAEAEKIETEIANGFWKGPLHGIPIGVKDMFDTAGVKTTAAFSRFQNRIPQKDAHAVTLLKDAGAILIGKTNLHELAMGTTSAVSHYGSVHNPWNTDYIAGGSSGGSAAVATNMCYATIDTDAIGSCRLPASCCGVTGFKSGPGTIDMHGILEGLPVEESILYLSQISITAGSARDAEIVFGILSSKKENGNGETTVKRESPKRGSAYKIGMVRNRKAEKNVESAFQEAANLLRSLGHLVEETEIPFSPSFDTRNIKKDREKFSEIVFKNYDLLILPTVTAGVPTIKEAVKNGPMALSPENTFFCNYYGLPAISLPCGRDRNGLPIGFQVIGPNDDGKNIFHLSNLFQSSTDWHTKRPKPN
ncbi:amidase [Leptospira ellisii]|uniref:Amidase n=1 Tax=Leptospira ellisii TaxID=2023197 RepID=A0A2N0BCV9_9LEPT|nr:amidase [Leptospira ellisii]MDV6236707.1 amidase [Leptospira ellisii]PJZ94386.1 amidase [Leptospira ellisii]PKA05528.1 amidase [Leptospira ellisii]